jgi:protein involved in polysaccharide export with SLBB domain
MQPVPMTLLRVSEPGEYKLDRGDVLAIVADEVLTKDNQPVPVQTIQTQYGSRSVQGVPVPVQEDGTIVLPLLDPIDVRGKTLLEVRKLLIDQIVTKKEIVVKGKERVLVDLLQPRRYRVLVLREDTLSVQPTAMADPSLLVAQNKKGAAFSVLLEAGHNDLLQALSQTGGPPGLDAKNELVICHKKYDPADPARGCVRIPLRTQACQPLLFSEPDITLEDGDTVSIEARDAEVYYATGLLGSAPIPLPRDYDLRVVEAVAQVRSIQHSQCNTNVGWVTVKRRLPNGQQIPIRVDLAEATRDQRENIIIQPGDLIVLPEQCSGGSRCWFLKCR